MSPHCIFIPLHRSYRRGEPPKFTPLMLLESNGVAPKGGWDPSTIVPPSLLSQTAGAGTGTGTAALPGKKKKKSKKSAIATSSDTETNDNEKRKNKVVYCLYGLYSWYCGADNTLLVDVLTPPPPFPLSSSFLC